MKTINIICITILLLCYQILIRQSEKSNIFSSNDKISALHDLYTVFVENGRFSVIYSSFKNSLVSFVINNCNFQFSVLSVLLTYPAFLRVSNIGSRRYGRYSRLSQAKFKSLAFQSSFVFALSNILPVYCKVSN